MMAHADLCLALCMQVVTSSSAVSSRVYAHGALCARSSTQPARSNTLSASAWSPASVELLPLPRAALCGSNLLLTPSRDGRGGRRGGRHDAGKASHGVCSQHWAVQLAEVAHTKLSGHPCVGGPAAHHMN
jgi:hypothetical protein